MGTVRVGNVDVAYAVEGRGEPVVLVHGTTSSAQASWLQVTPVLAERFTVIGPDLPGSGGTVAPLDKPLELDDIAEQTLAAATDAGAERFHLAGWSLGAVVAAAVAARAPDRVRTLALVCGWVRTDARFRFTLDLWRRLIETDPDLFARYAFADGLTAGSFEAFGVEGVESLLPTVSTELAPGSLAQIELDGRIDLSDRLASITSPTLVIGGSEDRWTSIDESRRLAADIRGARLVELPCGHLIPTEQAAALNDLLIGHFSS
jgi:pimeloyl-ACP methyl ester carboxylesterase